MMVTQTTVMVVLSTVRFNYVEMGMFVVLKNATMAIQFQGMAVIHSA